MSLLYRNQSGNEKAIAGLNGLSGELVYGASTVRQGLINVPSIDAESTADVTVVFDTPMPDTDYQVTIEYPTVGTLNLICWVKNKTANGFILGVGRPMDKESQPNVIKYTAFKLHSVEGLEDLETAVNDLETSKQDKLTFDTTPTANSTNPVTSGGILTALNAKQNTLTVSRTTIAVTNGSIQLAKYGRIVQASFQIVADNISSAFTSGVWTHYGNAGIIPSAYRPIVPVYCGKMVTEIPILMRVTTDGTLQYYWTGGQMGYEYEWTETWISAV